MRPGKGFTLIEILLVMTLTIILTIGGILFASQIVAFREFDRTVGLIRSQLVSAQSHAKGGTNDSAWGVFFSAHQMTSFSGSSYETRNTIFDQTTLFSSAVTLSGATSTVFTQPFGLPIATGTITVSALNLVDTISVNSQGVVEVVRVSR